MKYPRRVHAARYLRTLAAIETLLAMENYSEARRISEGIDYAECHALADELDGGFGKTLGRLLDERQSRSPLLALVEQAPATSSSPGGSSVASPSGVCSPHFYPQSLRV